MTDAEREAETKRIALGLRAKDPKLAEIWFWSFTPLPIGLPSDEQLEEGRQLLSGELTLAQLSEKHPGV
jgi:hypothetical protein